MIKINWTFNFFHKYEINNVSFKISTSRKWFILRKKYWFNVKFFSLSKLNFIFFVLFSESNLLKRYFFKNSFFHTIKLLFIFCWIKKNNSLCHSNVVSFKHKKRTRKITRDFSMTIICWKRRMKNSTKCLFELYIMTFCDRKVRSREIIIFFIE